MRRPRRLQVLRGVQRAKLLRLPAALRLHARDVRKRACIAQFPFYFLNCFSRFLQGTKPHTCQCKKGWTGHLCDKPVCSEGCDKKNGYCKKVRIFFKKMREITFFFFLCSARDLPVPQGLLRPQLQAVQHLLVLPGRTGDYTEHTDSQIKKIEKHFFPFRTALTPRPAFASLTRASALSPTSASARPRQRPGTRTRSATRSALTVLKSNSLET